MSFVYECGNWNIGRIVPNGYGFGWWQVDNVFDRTSIEPGAVAQGDVGTGISTPESIILVTVEDDRGQSPE